MQLPDRCVQPCWSLRYSPSSQQQFRSSSVKTKGCAAHRVVECDAIENGYSTRLEVSALTRQAEGRRIVEDGPGQHGAAEGDGELAHQDQVRRDDGDGADLRPRSGGRVSDDASLPSLPSLHAFAATLPSRGCLSLTHRLERRSTAARQGKAVFLALKQCLSAALAAQRTTKHTCAMLARIKRKACLVDLQKFWPFIATMMYAFFEMNFTTFSKLVGAQDTISIESEEIGLKEGVGA